MRLEKELIRNANKKIMMTEAQRRVSLVSRKDNNVWERFEFITIDHQKRIMPTTSNTIFDGKEENSVNATQ